MEEGSNTGALTFCVTGSTGYIGSWLVQSLLKRGYVVHATARDPEKASGLFSWWKGGGDRLKLFKADLTAEGSFDEAVKGCHGVFHVAASMEFSVLATHNIESYVQSHILDPAIKGTINLLKACLRAKSVKRVIFTSSISTMTAKDSDGKWKSVVDESCQTPIDRVWSTKASGWVYVLSKLLSEETAFQFAEEKGIDLISVITTTVAGTFLTPTIPASVRVLLSPISGDSEYKLILCAVHNRMGSIAVVHIEDICNAHIFLMEQTAAKGRYICSSHSCVMSELVDCLTQNYPFSNIQRSSDKQHQPIPSKISSKKLQELGFEYKYGLEEIIQQSISCCVQHGFLENPSINNSSTQSA